jgi:hypothetical protein
MTHTLIFPLLLLVIISWMNVWLWAYSLGPYSPTNPTGILMMTFWFIFIWTWFEVANLDKVVCHPISALRDPLLLAHD